MSKTDSTYEVAATTIRGSDITGSSTCLAMRPPGVGYRYRDAVAQSDGSTLVIWEKGTPPGEPVGIGPTDPPDRHA